MKNIKEEYKEFLLKDVISQKKGYLGWVNENNIDNRLDEIESQYKKAFGSNPFEFSDCQSAILTLKKNQKDKTKQDYWDFNQKAGSGIPGALINTHLLKFLQDNYSLITSSKKNKSKVSMEYLEILKQKKQIIFQGAPGTGKTYTAKDIAEEMLFENISSNKTDQRKRLETSDRFKLVQFHPSYTYEDFVRGIEVRTENGHPKYITINKVLGKFAEEAWENWHLHKSEIEDKVGIRLQKDVDFNQFIKGIKQLIDKQGKVQLTDKVYLFKYDDKQFRYKGRSWESSSRILYEDIEQAYNDNNKTKEDIKNNENLCGTAKQDSTYFLRILDLFIGFLSDPDGTISSLTVNKETTLLNYVLVIDEINRANLPVVLGELIYALEYRGEKVRSMYAIDEDDNGLILPPNLYIIGTMNTADRSVGQIDYAIRRRFAFIDMRPKSLNDEVDGFDEELFKAVSELFIKNYDEYLNNNKINSSDYISDEFHPEDFWIGQSYFVMKDKEGNNITSMRLQYEIIPILKEYIKDGIFKDIEAVKTKIEELKDRYLS